VKWIEPFELKPGVTAVIGSGGKTSLIEALAEELGRENRVIVTTTTKIRPPFYCPVLTGATREDVRRALERSSVVCVGEPVPARNGKGETETKLEAPRLALRELAELAPYVLIESDGAKHLPLKAHKPHEPVIPEEARLVIQIVGASGIGRSIGSAVHRPETFLERLGSPGLTVQTIATPERVAAVLAAERRGDILFINQTDTEEDRRNAERLAQCAETLGYRRIVAGSIRKRRMECLY